MTPTSFDMRLAPDANGFFVGDYEGLSALGTKFTRSGRSPTTPAPTCSPRHCRRHSLKRATGLQQPRATCLPQPSR